MKARSLMCVPLTAVLLTSPGGQDKPVHDFKSSTHGVGGWGWAEFRGRREKKRTRNLLSFLLLLEIFPKHSLPGPLPPGWKVLLSCKASC